MNSGSEIRYTKTLMEFIQAMDDNDFYNLIASIAIRNKELIEQKYKPKTDNTTEILYDMFTCEVVSYLSFFMRSLNRLPPPLILTHCKIVKERLQDHRLHDLIRSMSL